MTSSGTPRRAHRDKQAVDRRAAIAKSMGRKRRIRSISANGKIQPARWGKYSLSFLGENGSTRDIAISIHENAEGEAATLSGLNIEGDLDLEGHHYFFLELHVKQERFSTLSKELSTPGAALHISVRSDRFRDFYAEWSPSISEGRVIKFLDRKRDVENADEIPESFWLTPEFQRELIAPEWLKEVLCIADLVLIPVRCQRRSKIRPLWRSKSRPVWGERLGACGPHIASPVQGALAVRPIL